MLFSLCNLNTPLVRMIMLLPILGLIVCPSLATHSEDNTFPTQINQDVTKSAQEMNPSKRGNVKIPLLANRRLLGFWEGKEKDLDEENFNKEKSTSYISFPRRDEDQNKAEKFQRPPFPYYVGSQFLEGKERDMEGESFHKETPTSTVHTDNNKRTTERVALPLTLNPDWSNFSEGKERDMEGGTPHKEEASSVSSSLHNVLSRKDPVSPVSISPRKDDVIFPVTDVTKDDVDHDDKDLSNENPPVPTNTVHSTSLKTPTSSSSPPRRDGTADEYLERDIQKWVELWENAIHNRSHEQGTGKGEIESVISDPQRISTAASIFSTPDEISGSRPEVHTEKKITTLENAATGDTSVKEDSEKAKDDKVNPETPGLEKEETSPLPFPFSQYDSSIKDHPSSMHTSIEVPDETTLSSRFVSKGQNKDERLHEGSTDLLAKLDLGSDKVNFSLPESVKHALRNPDTNSKHASNNAVSGDSEIPTVYGNLLQQRQVVESRHISELRNGTKIPGDEKVSSVSEDNKFPMVVLTALIGGLSVILFVLVCVFIFCLFCKKQGKAFSEKTKKLTTLNTDGNRIDLQILRPSQKSLEAFTFGLPIPTVDETLRAVVVDSPYLKY